MWRRSDAADGSHPISRLSIRTTRNGLAVQGAEKLAYGRKVFADDALHQEPP